MDVVLWQEGYQSGQRAWFRTGQSITLGTSERSDFRVLGDPSIASICARIDVGDTRCQIASLGSHTLLEVNGASTNAVMLRSDDTIRIGRAVLRIHWDEGAAKSEPASIVEEASVVHRSYLQRRLTTGVVEWAPTGDTDWPMKAVMESACKQLTPIVLANYRSCNLPIPESLAAEKDLFSQAPAEIRQEHSLHAVHSRPYQQLWELYEPLADRDAAVWVLGASASDKLLSDLKLYLAWFCRPSILSMHLNHASQSFVEDLLRPLRAICVQTAGGKPWAIYSADPECWRECGLQAPPTHGQR